VKRTVLLSTILLEMYASMTLYILSCMKIFSFFVFATPLHFIATIHFDSAIACAAGMSASPSASARAHFFPSFSDRTNLGLPA